MRKAVLIAMVSLVSVTSANAAYICLVSGENPTQPHQYDQTLKVGEFDLFENKSEIIYTTSEYIISAGNSNAKDGLSVATSNKGKVIAMASGGSTLISLIDGTNKIAVGCKKK